ncbi:probable F-box protein At2g36090 [Beta vulgaris subsp. vulgaris]|uniref:probable F-box protein At2g36090 n=1 Tax=Beta vulgaris subsp. vulgaris TaxID=3555 RepID=UPI002036DC12|nr:probable F-box protein At2g36090 [Beta vulgaris subsp. vulgaris]
MSSSRPMSTTTTTTLTTAFSLLPDDVIRAHILPRLDGCSLAAVGCATPELSSLSSDHQLWSHICHSTWPSTATPRIRHLISSFPDGARSFFSLSFPLLSPNPHPPSPSSCCSLPDQLISAVDIFYRGKCMFSNVQETETVTGWFRCSPFRIDLLTPKESVPTPIRRPSHDDTCKDLYADLELSWIVMDPTGGRAVNVSSFRPVSVERHWLSGEVHVRYAAVVEGHVMCSVEVTCVGGGPGGGLVLHVTEACLKMEDVDGAHLNGKDSLVILQRVLEGKRGSLCKKGGMEGRVEEGRRRYLEYLERKRERRERVLRREGRLDNMCVGIGVFLFVGIIYLLCFSSSR